MFTETIGDSHLVTGGDYSYLWRAGSPVFAVVDPGEVRATADGWRVSDWSQVSRVYCASWDRGPVLTGGEDSLFAAGEVAEAAEDLERDGLTDKAFLMQCGSARCEGDGDFQTLMALAVAGDVGFDSLPPTMFLMPPAGAPNSDEWAAGWFDGGTAEAVDDSTVEGLADEVEAFLRESA